MLGRISATSILNHDRNGTSTVGLLKASTAGYVLSTSTHAYMTGKSVAEDRLMKGSSRQDFVDRNYKTSP